MNHKLVRPYTYNWEAQIEKELAEKETELETKENDEMIDAINQNFDELYKFVGEIYKKLDKHSEQIAAICRYLRTENQPIDIMFEMPKKDNKKSN